LGAFVTISSHVSGHHHSLAIDQMAVYYAYAASEAEIEILPVQLIFIRSAYSSSQPDLPKLDRSTTGRKFSILSEY
jgi:hypothetical protein